ncbi:hypothetical protein FACS1894204_07880 [Synergistales bacterium]|nr:hypothetical protein FACS1894204_07880 [Synergistales bacterium]
MEIHTLEMKKLPENKSDDDRENELIDWLRLIRSDREDEIEMLATKTPEMKMAVGRLKQLSADERTRMRYEARELYLMDEMARIEGAEARGIAKGNAEGKAEGQHEKALEVARSMFADAMSVDIVSKFTGLSVEELNKLRARKK